MPRLIAVRHGPRQKVVLRGLSIVELLVGIAVGLFILAGATLVTSNQLSDNRLLLLETQMQQDLRTTADLIAREVRRSGYWGKAATTTWGASVVPNMYQTFDKSPGSGGRDDEVTFSYSKALSSGAENGVSDPDEKFGFALNSASGTIESLVGAAGWQALTDSNVMRVTQFDMTPNEQVLVVPCANPCAGGGTACWPRQKVRDVTIQITGQAVHDATVVRSVRSGVRLRNDDVTGACPP
jgi:prepilin peptidase dependent protein B